MSGGLDIAGRYEEIRRLTYRHPLFRVAVARGHDPDDLMQSVALGLLTRQQGSSAYDPSRANTPARAFSKYVYVVAGSVLANVLDSARRRGRHEQVGAVSLGPDGFAERDASLMPLASRIGPEEGEGGTLDAGLMEDTLQALPGPVAAVARDVLEGVTPADVCERHGITRPGLARVVLRVESMARAVRDGVGYLDDEDEREPVPMGEQLGLWPVGNVLSS